MSGNKNYIFFQSTQKNQTLHRAANHSMHNHWHMGFPCFCDCNGRDAANQLRLRASQVKCNFLPQNPELKKSFLPRYFSLIYAFGLTKLLYYG